MFLILTLASCRQDMQDQPKYLPYRGSEIFPDSLSSRNLVEGTVPRGYLWLDQALYTGKSGTAGHPADSAKAGATMGTAKTSVPTRPAAAAGSDVNEFPFPITKEILDRGQERFNIYCSPCHGVLGDGRGMIVNRGFRPPPSYHQDRLRTAPLGHFFDVITNGFGAMPDYSMQIPPHERWAIIAYIRALQLSQNANIADVPSDQVQNIK
ncbi:MAG TPA: cytochrome c [Candidatus Kapabacteria bacterium]